MLFCCPFLEREVAQWDIIHSDVVLAQLVGAYQVVAHAGDIKHLMKEKNVSVVGGRAIISNCSSDNRNVVNGSKFLVKWSHRNSVPCFLDYCSAIPKSGGVSTGIKFCYRIRARPCVIGTSSSS